MELELRPARPSDTEFARGVHHRAYREVVERQLGPWAEEEQDRYFERGWAAAFDVVLCDGVPCGYLCVEDQEHDVHARAIALLPEVPGRGICSSLLRDVIGRARRRAVPARLGTFETNRAAAPYRRLGFRETGRTGAHPVRMGRRARMIAGPGMEQAYRLGVGL